MMWRNCEAIGTGAMAANPTSSAGEYDSGGNEAFDRHRCLKRSTMSTRNILNAVPVGSVNF